MTSLNDSYWLEIFKTLRTCLNAFPATSVALREAAKNSSDKRPMEDHNTVRDESLVEYYLSRSERISYAHQPDSYTVRLSSIMDREPDYENRYGDGDQFINLEISLSGNRIAEGSNRDNAQSFSQYFTRPLERLQALFQLAGLETTKNKSPLAGEYNYAAYNRIEEAFAHNICFRLQDMEKLKSAVDSEIERLSLQVAAKRQKDPLQKILDEIEQEDGLGRG